MELYELEGRTALVTGGARRIGRATTAALAQNGVNVLVHYNASETEARESAEELKRLGVEAWTVRGDLHNQKSIDAVFDEAVTLAGKIDILINNASVFGKSGLLDFTREELDREISINAMAPMLLIRRFSAESEQGKIINMLDSSMVRYNSMHVAYHLSKKMLFDLTKLAAVELAPRIAVNAVAPGLILPPEGEDNAYMERLARKVPLRRTGSLTCVTEAILFLLKCDYITGQVIYVDGGAHLKGCMYGGT